MKRLPYWVVFLFMAVAAWADTPADVLEFFQNLPRCLVGIEACGTAHHWAREITALGHVVKLLPPSYVKPYVKRGKTDAADAEAICEAVTRPGMRFVPVKTVARQSVLMPHRTRDLLVRQRIIKCRPERTAASRHPGEEADHTKSWMRVNC